MMGMLGEARREAVSQGKKQDVLRRVAAALLLVPLFLNGYLLAPSRSRLELDIPAALAPVASLVLLLLARRCGVMRRRLLWTILLILAILFILSGAQRILNDMLVQEFAE